MMLFIDTAQTEGFFIALIDSRPGRLIVSKRVAGRFRQSEMLLKTVDTVLQKAGVGVKKIAAVAVVSGPGPFTATRIGVSVANAFAYARGIPIVGLERSEGGTLEGLLAAAVQKVGKAQAAKRPVWVEPVYDREPNITQPARK